MIMKSDSRVLLSSQEILRSTNDRFYFIETDTFSNNSRIIEIKFECKHSKFRFEKREIFALYATRILLLDRDFSHDHADSVMSLDDAS